MAFQQAVIEHQIAEEMLATDEQAVPPCLDLSFPISMTCHLARNCNNQPQQIPP
jgi:hypothetical protein